jgi:hypothetical protein
VGARGNHIMSDEESPAKYGEYALYSQIRLGGWRQQGEREIQAGHLHVNVTPRKVLMMTWCSNTAATAHLSVHPNQGIYSQYHCVDPPACTATY